MRTGRRREPACIPSYRNSEKNLQGVRYRKAMHRDEEIPEDDTCLSSGFRAGQSGFAGKSIKIWKGE